MTKTILPLADRVVIRIIKTPPSLSGIILPEAHTEQQVERGLVIAIGKGRRNDNGEHVPLELVVNDEVFFSRFAAEIVVHDGEELFILREDQILALLQ